MPGIALNALFILIGLIPTTTFSRSSINIYLFSRRDTSPWGIDCRRLMAQTLELGPPGLAILVLPHTSCVALGLGPISFLSYKMG